MPKISDIHPVNAKFNAGDRVLVKVFRPTTLDQQRRIQAAVQKFISVDVRVFVFSAWRSKLLKVRDGCVELLAGPKQMQYMQPEFQSAFHLDCAVVDLRLDDVLEMQVPIISSDSHRYSLEIKLREWAGNDVEIHVTGGLGV